MPFFLVPLVEIVDPCFDIVLSNLCIGFSNEVLEPAVVIT
jgi:hypothetical protein